MKNYTLDQLESMMKANHGNLVLRHSEVTSLPDNLTVEGDLYLYNTPITSLPDNLTVGGDLWLDGTPITSLPDNLRVHGSIHLERTQITSLPVNFSVGRDLVLNDTPITSLPDYLTVGRDLELENTQITSLPEHLAVGGRLNLYGTKITSLPKSLEGEPVVITPDNRLVPWYSFKKYKKITDDDIDRIDVNGDYCPNNCRWATEKGCVSMKNADKIRSMSDEELQAWFCRNRDCWDCPFRCWDRCTFADWIKQPAEQEIHIDISDAKL